MALWVVRICLLGVGVVTVADGVRGGRLGPRMGSRLLRARITVEWAPARLFSAISSRRITVRVCTLGSRSLGPMLRLVTSPREGVAWDGC